MNKHTKLSRCYKFLIAGQHTTTENMACFFKNKFLELKLP